MINNAIYLELSREDVVNLFEILKKHINYIDRTIEECGYHGSDGGSFIPERNIAVDLKKRIKEQIAG
jgi:hypothetical protein